MCWSTRKAASGALDAFRLLAPAPPLKDTHASRSRCSVSTRCFVLALTSFAAIVVLTLRRRYQDPRSTTFTGHALASPSTTRAPGEETGCCKASARSPASRLLAFTDPLKESAGHRDGFAHMAFDDLLCVLVKPRILQELAVRGSSAGPCMGGSVSMALAWPTGGVSMVAMKGASHQHTCCIGALGNGSYVISFAG